MQEARFPCGLDLESSTAEELVVTEVTTSSFLPLVHQEPAEKRAAEKKMDKLGSKTIT